jgi:hypothetical protein
MIANQIAGFLTGGVVAPLTDYESIATVTVGSGGSSTVTFSSISSAYTHLQIRLLYRNTSAYSNIQMQFNGDTASNYAWHEVWGNGTDKGTSALTSQTHIRPVLGASGTTNQAVGIIDILDYASTNKNKTTRSLSGADANGTENYIILRSGLWFKTPEAITSISLTPQAGLFGEYSHFALYGIK